MASFTTNPVRLEELLLDCEGGILKLPDFQRSWSGTRSASVA